MPTKRQALKQVEDKIVFAERLAKLMGDSFTKKEFLDAFEQVTRAIQTLADRMKEENKREISDFRSEYRQAKAELAKGNSDAMDALDKKLTASLQEKLALMDTKALLLDEKIATVRNGEDADEDKIVEVVLSRVPPPPPPDTADDIRNKLEVLQGDDRLEQSAIKNLPEDLKKIQNAINNIPRGGMRGMRKVPIVKKVRLTSQVDGATRAFKLPQDTVQVLGLWGTSFPITFDDADWTLAGNTLTLATPIPTPESGQTLMALVETLFY